MPEAMSGGRQNEERSPEEKLFFVENPNFKPGDYQPDSSKPFYNPYDKPQIHQPGQSEFASSHRSTQVIDPTRSGEQQSHRVRQLTVVESPKVGGDEPQPGDYQPDSSKPFYNPYDKPKLHTIDETKPGSPDDLIVKE